jgi:hypothetical protein
MEILHAEQTKPAGWFYLGNGLLLWRLAASLDGYI